MAVTLGSRGEITLDVFERLAWRGESVRVEATALERADATRRAFLSLLARTAGRGASAASSTMTPTPT
jgi:hypothetical protein